MHQRLLQIAIVIAGIVLVMLGAHRLWQRSGAPSGTLEGALTMPALAASGLPSGVTDEPPGAAVDGFFVANVTEVPAPAPPARVPAALHDPWPASFADDLCAGREDAWASVDGLLASAGADAIERADLDALATATVHGCFTPQGARACAWATAALAEGEPRASLAWRLLAHCDDATALPLLDRVDAPADAILRFVVDREALGRRAVRLPAYLLQAVTGALAGADTDAVADAAAVPFVDLASGLGRYDDPAATRALVALFESAPGYARETIGVAIRFPDDDRSRAIHQESCATVAAGSYVSACDDGSLAARVGSYAFDPELELARHPESRDDVLTALAECSAGHEPPASMMCLRRLAALDRARASSLAAARITQANVPLLGLPAVGDPPPYLSGIEEELRRFPSEGSLLAALASAGVRADPDARLFAHPVTVLEALAARGHAFGIDSESGTFPTPHDVLLRRLARLVGPALDAVVFEQVAPDESQMAVGRYTLRATIEGVRVEAFARNYGDFYDVEAVVGLVNALLVRRGALDRCVLSSDVRAGLVYSAGASVPQLTALRDSQLLPADEASAEL